MSRDASEKDQDAGTKIAKRWTPALVQGGWTPISMYFLDNYSRLKPKMSSLEAMLIIHLIRYKWDARNPYPTFATLASRMGISATAARGHARSLEKKGYLKRLPITGSSNQFNMNLLFKKLEELMYSDKAPEDGADDKSSPDAVVAAPPVTRTKRRTHQVTVDPPAGRRRSGKPADKAKTKTKAKRPPADD